MHKVELSYLLSPQRGRDALIRNPMMDMLHAVSEQGSISKAAAALRLSYRHVWGSLKGDRFRGRASPRLSRPAHDRVARRSASTRGSSRSTWSAAA